MNKLKLTLTGAIICIALSSCSKQRTQPYTGEWKIINANVDKAHFTETTLPDFIASAVLSEAYPSKLSIGNNRISLIDKTDKTSLSDRYSVNAVDGPSTTITIQSSPAQNASLNLKGNDTLVFNCEGMEYICVR